MENEEKRLQYLKNCFIEVRIGYQGDGFSRLWVCSKMVSQVDNFELFRMVLMIGFNYSRIKKNRDKLYYIGIMFFLFVFIDKFLSIFLLNIFCVIVRYYGELSRNIIFYFQYGIYNYYDYGCIYVQYVVNYDQI